MTDVFVVGGGPAGLAAAIAARLSGMQVTVADPAHPPIDKACGEGLLPQALPALSRMGVSIPGFALAGIGFHGDGVSVHGSFAHGPAIAIRRTILHQLLVYRAAELGVKLLWGTRVASLADISTRWIVGADGLNSRVRRWAGLDAVRSESVRYGFRRHYRIAPWSDYVEIYWQNGCQIYVTPIGPEEIGVAVLARDPQLRIDQALLHLPTLRGARPTSTERGAITASRHLRRIYRGSTILLGDASGSVDAVTGEGLSLAFQQALALADALAAENPAAYAREHRRLARRPSMMATLMLKMDRFPPVRRLALRTLAAHPDLFAKLIEFHTAPTTKPIRGRGNFFKPLMNADGRG